MKADLVILNSKIYTPEFVPHTAIAIKDGIIQELGNYAKISSWIQKGKTKVLELPNGSILPGIIDSHCHFSAFIRSRQELIMDSSWSKEVILQKVQDELQNRSKGTWLLGRGWNQGNWNHSKFPTARDLDLISPEHPVILTSRDCHTVWLNSKALENLGITSLTKSPFGGKIHSDIFGNPSGILTENALQWTNPITNQKDISLEEAKSTLEYFYSLGITGFHTLESPKELLFLQELVRKKILKGRIRFSIPLSFLDSSIQMGLQSSFGGQLRFSGVKIFADGALGSKTAYMKDPYLGISSVGRMVIALEELEKKICQAILAGISVIIHSIGDGSMEIILDAFEKVFQKIQPPFSLFHRIEHSQHITKKDKKRMGKLNLIASMQPYHLLGDRKNIQQFLPNRQNIAYPFLSLEKEKVLLAFGSDTPIESPNPFLGIWASMMRDVFLEGQEAISRELALKAYTENGALAFGERDLGKIAPSYQADLIGVNDDFGRMKGEQIQNLKVKFTIVHGKVVFRAPE